MAAGVGRREEGGGGEMREEGTQWCCHDSSCHHCLSGNLAGWGEAKHSPHTHTQARTRSRTPLKCLVFTFQQVDKNNNDFGVCENSKDRRPFS